MELKTWRFNKHLESKLMSMEIHFLGRPTRLEKIRNNVIRENINIKNSVLDYIIYKQLNWNGHVQRMDEKTSKNFGMVSNWKNKKKKKEEKKKKN